MQYKLQNNQAYFSSICAAIEKSPCLSKSSPYRLYAFGFVWFLSVQKQKANHLERPDGNSGKLMTELMGFLHRRKEHFLQRLRVFVSCITHLCIWPVRHLQLVWQPFFLCCTCKCPGPTCPFRVMSGKPSEHSLASPQPEGKMFALELFFIKLWTQTSTLCQRKGRAPQPSIT